MSRKGESIYKRKDGRWEARYIHHYENGKARYRFIYGKSYAEVKEKRLAELSQPEKERIPTVKNNCTFTTLSNLWLADIKPEIKESSYTRYYRIVEKHLQPVFHHIPLYKIESDKLPFLTKYLMERGGVHGKPLSSKTVSDIICVLKAVFKYGISNNYPCPDPDLLKYPRKKPAMVSILSDDSRKIIEESALKENDLASLGILFTLFTGVRIGELCGLQWKDIDLGNSMVCIRRTIQRIRDLDPEASARTKVIVSEPKTSSSIRTIPIPVFLTEHLKQYKKSDECFFLTGTRSYTEPHQYYMYYRQFLEKNNIEPHTFHALRHTFATRCVELGFDTKSLSEILGHSNITTTLNIYIHPSMEQKRKQMERLTPECFL